MPDLSLTLDFLRALAEHNNRDWFTEHRADYDRARLHFETLIEDIIVNFQPIEDLYGLQPKDCMFRINRDVRFSKDKSPYKTSMSAAIAQGGKKSDRHSYYIHIQPGESFVAGGVYMPEPDQLKRMRTALAEDARSFRAIIIDKAFVKQFGGIEGEQLKNPPKGYDPEHPDVDLLRYKQMIARRTFTDADVISPKFLKQALAAFAALKPFLDYFNTTLAKL